MRTTVTLDADVLAGIRALERERGVSFKEALNSAVRAGLASRGPQSGGAYVARPFHAEIAPGVDLRIANRLLADLEDTELARKVELGK